MFIATAWSRSSPILIGRSQRVNVGRSKPAIWSCSETVSGLAIENGPGPQRTSCGLLGLLQVLLDHLFRPVKPLVVELAPPHAGHQAAPGTQCAGDVAERLHRIGEEHHPHPRERVVVGTSQVADLHVGREEVDVPDSLLPRVLDRGLDEGLGDVHAGGMALGADQGGQLLGGVAEAAADVEDAIPLAGRIQPHAASPCAPRPATTRSRYSTKRSKRTPLQASVASSFSAATTRPKPAPFPRCLLHAPMVRPEGLLLHIRR